MPTLPVLPPRFELVRVADQAVIAVFGRREDAELVASGIGAAAGECEVRERVTAEGDAAISDGSR